MRALLQRVARAEVRVEGEVVGSIGRGLLVLLGVAHDDQPAVADAMARRIVELRIHEDADGRTNLALGDVGGAILAVSQFTLFASTKKGARPSWSGAAPPEIARPRFVAFVAALQRELGQPVATGAFGAHMQVTLVNDGPVTLWLDSRARE